MDGLDIIICGGKVQHQNRKFQMQMVQGIGQDFLSFSDNEKLQTEDDDEFQETKNQNNQSQKPSRPRQHMPQQFYKAKRTITKLMTNYFKDLKSEYLRTRGRLYLNTGELETIQQGLSNYIGIRSKGKPYRYEIEIKQPETDKYKPAKEYRNGLFLYLAQSKKIVNYTCEGKVATFGLTWQSEEFFLPDLATPVPFNQNIYLLDSCRYNADLRTFVADQAAYRIEKDNRIVKLEVKPKHYRTRCAIIKDKRGIYLLGGAVTEHCVLTRSCELYDPNTNKFIEIEGLRQIHQCPSATILSDRIWLFSKKCIECYDMSKREWQLLGFPFGANFKPFQFCYPISQRQIILFGGTFTHKSSDLQVFNVQSRSVDNYGLKLPQAICSERSWGPCFIQGQIAALSNIQASVYPQTASKENIVQIVYVGPTASYLNNLIVL